MLLKNLLFTLVVPGTVAFYVPWRLSLGRAVASGPELALAVVVLAAGTATYGWCVWDFATFGRGTPAPIDAPNRLVVRGLYRFTRNPMYLGVLTVLVGWAVLYRSAALVFYALAIATLFHLFVVFYEEPHLHRRFGADYGRYRAGVPRWLPRVPKGVDAGQNPTGSEP